VAKKKRAGATKRAGTRRKAARAPRKRTAGASAKTLKLRDLRPLVEKSIRNLEIASARAPGRYSETRARLQRWMDDMDWICDDNNPDGCGPVMVFPLSS
jgi:hypothetical protein